MIKVISGYKLKQGANIQPVLLKLRSHAMTYPGYVGAENLVNDRDTSIVAIITSWESVNHWKAWESSTSRKDIMRGAEPLLEEEMRVTIYRVIPTTRWSV